MKFLNADTIKILHNALTYYAAHQEEIISEHYLDVDHEQFVEESQKILDKLNLLSDCFGNHKAVHVLNEQDYRTVNQAFVASETIYNSSHDYVLKAGMYLGLIDGIKAIFMKKDD